VLKTLARPERLLEAIHLPARAREQNCFVDHDRPHPHGSDHESDHHRLDDEMRLPEQSPERHLRRRDFERALHHLVHSKTSTSVPEILCAAPVVAGGGWRLLALTRHGILAGPRCSDRPKSRPNRAKLGHSAGYPAPEQSPACLIKHYRKRPIEKASAKSEAARGFPRGRLLVGRAAQFC